MNKFLFEDVNNENKERKKLMEYVSSFFFKKILREFVFKG